MRLVYLNWATTPCVIDISYVIGPPTLQLYCISWSWDQWYIFTVQQQSHTSDADHHPPEPPRSPLDLAEPFRDEGEEEASRRRRNCLKPAIWGLDLTAPGEVSSFACRVEDAAAATLPKIETPAPYFSNSVTLVQTCQQNLLLLSCMQEAMALLMLETAK